MSEMDVVRIAHVVVRRLVLNMPLEVASGLVGVQGA